MTDKIQKTDSQNREVGIFNMMAMFFGVFGVTIIVAIFFTETMHGKVVNLISGILLLISALVPLLKVRSFKKKQKSQA
ncbi:hypothetical protein H8E88_32650 [candidate division KSB1 bacterium]|nr:hypothetical protein [candidate division KSB1 bacterium]